VTTRQSRRCGPTEQPAGILVLTVANDRITAITRFLDPRLQGHFCLPDVLRWAERGDPGPE